MAKKFSTPIPREHGAWALLYGPFIVAAASLSIFNLRLAVLLITITGLFLAHEPLSKFSRISRHGVAEGLKEHWAKWLGIYLSLSLPGACFLIISYRLWYLVPIGIAVGVLLAIHLLLISKKKERKVAGELIGVLGLTATAPVTCYVLSGELSYEAFLLWLLNILFFAGGIFFVKMRVSRFLKPAKFRVRALQCGSYYLGVLIILIGMVIAGWISPLIILAYSPVIVRAFWSIFVAEDKLNLRRIGYTEVLYTVCFVLVFVVAW